MWVYLVLLLKGKCDNTAAKLSPHAGFMNIYVLNLCGWILGSLPTLSKSYTF